ncbi:six-hairpin glycosidase [Zunongwangia endophytica]|uniref:Six-hairpin glycosidase n=1 Tax=Zunongwangia endophytica TaxID=1808945 RepID=A0ABV8HA73_9FLAO|nr:six-hairpin glycosidase [Zunongwangia endophytica]MDN3594824.1 six-hairpin glycosidase [Zunongwangia endophytica]
MRLNLRSFKKLVITLIFSTSTLIFYSQKVDTAKYVGTTLSNIDYHHGQLRPAVGTHATQIMRASREHPETADGLGWTYNHAPNIAYWNNTFFVQYLNDSIGEHIPPSTTLLITSKNGKDWTKPEVIFPEYNIPNGWTKEGVKGEANNITAVMHQRMGFYKASNGKFLTLAYYGIALNEKDDPNDGKGIGRVVREIKKDGSLGPIYFIRYNKTWDKSLSEYAFYNKSKDKEFVKACEELLSKPLMMQQWVEEQDRDDALIPLKDQFKAFSYYHLADGRTVGWWKHALTSLSLDGGENWEYHPMRAPGFVNSNAKIWGQKTSDGKYATVYNPSEFRWPLALSTSSDGLVYDNLFLVHGEISPMRYRGNYKSYGPQYVRGILESNGNPPDRDMWLTYSVNKEDIWVAKVPVPITATVNEHIDETFNELPDGAELNMWNYYDLQWATVGIEKKDDVKWLALKDKDAFDYARVDRIIPHTENLHATFTVMPGQNNHGMLQVEFQNQKGLPAVRLIFNEEGELITKSGARFKHILDYELGKEYEIDITLEPSRRWYSLTVNGKHKTERIFYSPVHAFERIMFRTGEQRYFPTPDTPADNYKDLENTGKQIPEAAFYIKGLKTEALKK